MMQQRLQITAGVCGCLSHGQAAVLHLDNLSERQPAPPVAAQPPLLPAPAAAKRDARAVQGRTLHFLLAGYIEV